MSSQKTPQISDDVRFVKSVGPKKAEKLRTLGIDTVYQLLSHFPFRIDDFSKITPMDHLTPGDSVTIQGKVIDVRFTSGQRGRILRVKLSDTKGVCYLVWYNMPYMARNFPIGKTVAASGRIEWRRSSFEISHPIYQIVKDSLTTGPIVPIYHVNSQISSQTISSTMKHALNVYLPVLSQNEAAFSLLMKENGYLSVADSFREIHTPSSAELWHRARESLAFKEILELQIAFGLMRQKSKEVKGPKITDLKGAHDFLNSLPFELTGAQKKTLNDMFRDFKSGQPMNRLLQGDVGSGKTVVALAGLIAAIENGYQAALLAPTEILARQHFQTFAKLHGTASVRLLTGSLQESIKENIKKEIHNGKTLIIVGTHAMLMPDVRWHNLGLVVTDEQHRFGVRQRLALSENGEYSPHVLSMSATPIPRSLALTLYGDLDISVIDELPPGRQEVKTLIASEQKRQAVYKTVREEVKCGRQAYVVCPAIEETESGKKSVSEVFHDLRNGYLKGLNLAVLHGSMPKKEMEKVMQLFLDKKIDVLVCTTVIEVGIDVPNATCMVIESAHNFGLGTLHQLRGRIGRGKHKSMCFLVSSKDTPRLKMLAHTSDGFKIAEFDLSERGPGQFFGIRQHGLPELKAHCLGVSLDTIQKAQEVSRKLFQEPDGNWHEICNKIEDHFGDLLTTARSR
jgi:ATP-dependent DNA helicase RecG